MLHGEQKQLISEIYFMSDMHYVGSRAAFQRSNQEQFAKVADNLGCVLSRISILALDLRDTREPTVTLCFDISITPTCGQGQVKTIYEQAK